MRERVLLLCLAVVLVATPPVAAMPRSSQGPVTTPDTVMEAVERVLALPYTAGYLPQGADAAFGAEDYPAAFPLTDTADGTCCAGSVPDQPPAADLAPPFAAFPEPFDRIQLVSRDGTPLHAFVSIVPGAPGVVVAQGFNTNGKHSIVRYAAALRAAGYSVIAPDHRDMGREWVRGGSWSPTGERRGQTLGWKEAEDFLAAAAELDDRGVERIGMLGLSEGAQNTILALAEDHDGLLDAVMTFSAPADQATQAQRNDAATAALLTTVVNEPDLCGYLARVGQGAEFATTANHVLRQDSAIDALDGLVGGADVDRVPGLHLYAADDTLVQPYHATMLASRTRDLAHHHTVLVQAGNHAYFYDRWWVQSAVLEWFGTWLDPEGYLDGQPTVAQTPGGRPMADQLIDLSGTTRADGDAERRPLDACPDGDEPVGPTALLRAEVVDTGEVLVDARGSWSGWDDHELTAWRIDLGDGTVRTGGDLADALVRHRYDVAGPRAITATVTDDTGRRADRTVTVEVPGVVERVSGEDRIGTAVAVSRSAFGAVDTVVLAAAGDFADGLSAAPLATQLGSPVLLVGDTLDPRVLTEVERLGALSVLLVGGEAAIPAAVADALAEASLSVARIAGTDRFDTARLVAGMVGAAAGTVVVVDGGSFADAVSAAGLAARSGAPLLLTDGSRSAGSVPPSTAAALTALAPQEVIVVGGPGAVSEATAQAVGVTVRLAGPDRYGTSVAVALRSLEAGLDPTRVWVADGGDFPDALAVGAAAARGGDVMILVDGAGPGPVTLAWLDAQPVRRLTVTGATGAISGRTLEQLATALSP